MKPSSGNEKRSHCSNQVGSEPKNCVSDVLCFGISPLRPICFTSEQEIASVSVSCSRSRSICSGCSFNQLERNISSDPNISQENSRGGVLSVSDCSPVGGSGMVSITVVTSYSTFNQPTQQSRSSDSTCVATVSSHSRDILTARLAAMQQRMQVSRISGTVARIIYSSKRSSTNNSYDYRWNSWVDWCFRRKVDPFSPSVNIFC